MSEHLKYRFLLPHLAFPVRRNETFYVSDNSMQNVREKYQQFEKKKKKKKKKKKSFSLVLWSLRGDRADGNVLKWLRQIMRQD